MRKKVVSRPVYTERETKDAIVDERTIQRSVPVQVPGNVTIREQYIQPTVQTVTERLNVQRGETRAVNNPVVTRPTKYDNKTVYRDF
ncbi:MAG: hypothetical protein DHS20C13_30840 [Thermodesulfobacteriota bacterium]|nr:MAG: hypothetical protein DHS20C13_30840 [Thermodesulfobacteriota bacterium]